MRSSSRTSRSITERIAVAARSGSPASDSTAQLCAMESIWHSLSLAEPSGLPSSK